MQNLYKSVNLSVLSYVKNGGIIVRTQVKEKNAMDITEKIKKLKEEKNAVILAHYYVRPEVQEIADYIGDSFYLSKVAVGLKEQTIVFAGVSFMGESAKILNPGKTVLLPDAAADCPMAHMADIETIKKCKEESRKDGPYAGCLGGLCHGAYGRCPDHKQNAGYIRGSGSGVLH